ncbi:MAG: NAD-glutamate dehydrogenase domain-containing protein, partial [Gammaproteobacteria bacterium]
MAQSALTKRQIMTQVCDHIREKLPAQMCEMVAEFAFQYLGTISPEDLEGREVDELYGIIISYWKFISQRLPGELKIRVFNPDYEQDGWQSTHTIVEMITDDMPFLVDSLRMEINRQNLNMYLMINYGGIKIRRDLLGNITEILPFTSIVDDGIHAEAPIYIEIDRQTNPEVLENLANNLRRVLQDVRYAVEDWSKMRSKMHEVLQELEPSAPLFEVEEFNETKDFLTWLDNNHFTFLGYRKYEMVDEGDTLALKLMPESSLGVLRNLSKQKQVHRLSDLVPEARKQALSRHILIISKTNTISSVHRPAYSDYIGVKCFDPTGKLIGEHRFIGLYTSAAYTSNPRYIPFVRRKVATIMKNSNLSPTGHAAKALLNILETLPRDDLFQASTEELAELTMGILHLQERKRIRVFARNDVFRRFISCLVYLPRERFDTALADAMQTYLKQAFSALEISYSIWFSESVLARLHFVARTDPKKPLTYNLDIIEERLIEIARLWQDDLYSYLHDYYGEEKGNAAFYNYKDAFPAGYRETFNPATAVFDIEHMRSLEEDRPLAMSFYRPLEESPGIMRFKLFRKDETIALSDSLPIFENMGMHVIGERPYEITTRNRTNYWINDFSMTYSYEMAFEVEAIKGLFQETFFRVWIGDAENDGFNRLVLGAGLSWREVMVIRAYAKYLKQLGLTYSQAYIELCFIKYPTLAFLLVQLFLTRHDPKKVSTPDVIASIETKIASEMDFITVLDEDKIIRKMHEAMMATLRTNYFQVDEHGQPKKYFSIKVEPSLISEVPLPIPMYEIFVYSPRFEGVHLRSSKVARGGIRWSDRREDFRTEILGLMKAQNVKNAVIVPSGA